MTLIAGTVVIAAGVLPSRLGARAQSKGAPSSSTEWPTYGHDPGGARYSPLTEITPANVSRLSVAWVYHMKPTDATAPAPQRQTPRWRTRRLLVAVADAEGAAVEVRVFPPAKQRPSSSAASCMSRRRTVASWPLTRRPAKRCGCFGSRPAVRRRAGSRTGRAMPGDPRASCSGRVTESSTRSTRRRASSIRTSATRVS